MRHKKTIHDPKYVKLISFLVEARHEAGLDQRKLAKRLGIQNSIIAKIETRERRLDVLELIEILRIIDPKKANSIEKTLKLI